MPSSFDKLRIGDVYKDEMGRRFIASAMCPEPSVHLTLIEEKMDADASETYWRH